MSELPHQFTGDAFAAVELLDEPDGFDPSAEFEPVPDRGETRAPMTGPHGALWVGRRDVDHAGGLSDAEHAAWLDNFRAGCECGWRGPVRPGDAPAWIDAADHAWPGWRAKPAHAYWQAVRGGLWKALAPEVDPACAVVPGDYCAGQQPQWRCGVELAARPCRGAHPMTDGYLMVCTAEAHHHVPAAAALAARARDDVAAAEAWWEQAIGEIHAPLAALVGGDRCGGRSHHALCHWTACPCACHADHAETLAAVTAHYRAWWDAAFKDSRQRAAARVGGNPRPFAEQITAMPSVAAFNPAGVSGAAETPAVPDQGEQGDLFALIVADMPDLPAATPATRPRPGAFEQLDLFAQQLALPL